MGEYMNCFYSQKPAVISQDVILWGLKETAPPRSTQGPSPSLGGESAFLRHSAFSKCQENLQRGPCTQVFLTLSEIRTWIAVICGCKPRKRVLVFYILERLISPRPYKIETFQEELSETIFSQTQIITSIQQVSRHSSPSNDHPKSFPWG